MTKKHKDVDFEVYRKRRADGKAEARKVYQVVPRGEKKLGTFPSFEKACAVAAVEAATHGGTAYVDVIVWSEAGARWWGGDVAVDEYLEDPEASVFERIEIKAKSLGRIA